MRLKKPTISAKAGEKPDRSGSFSKNREESESLDRILADVIPVPLCTVKMVCVADS